MTTKPPLFHRGHYNILAAQIRDLHGQAAQVHHDDSEYRRSLTARHTLEAFAVSLAKRLEKDNPEFNPVLFLNSCSSNTLYYPLGELWEGYD